MRCLVLIVVLAATTTDNTRLCSGKPRQVQLMRRHDGRSRTVRRQHPGDAGFSLAGSSSSVGAACARGRGFDVEEYAQRIYRANINLVLAEVPRDYSKPAQAPDF
jgi:hypothetical protein